MAVPPTVAVATNLAQLRAVLDQWRALGREALDNRAVTWHEGTKIRRGFACGLSDGGALIVRGADAAPGAPRLEHLIAGDVLWETWSRE